MEGQDTSLNMGLGSSVTHRTPVSDIIAYVVRSPSLSLPRPQVGTPMERPNAAAAADAPITIAVSTAFQPTMLVDHRLPDLDLLSSDNVHFYVHRALVLAASRNTYGRLLAPPPPPNASRSPPVVPVPERADVLNIVAHAIYRLPVAQFAPSFAAVSAAFDALVRYGVPLAPLCLPGSPLHALVLSLAPPRPIEAYALAAHHDLPALAAPISAHLLAYPLTTLSDSLAQRIGPIYLKLLFLLHSGRMEALKKLLLRPPQGHEPTSDCDATQQERLTRSWALASVRLAWDAQPSACPHPWSL